MYWRSKREFMARHKIQNELIQSKEELLRQNAEFSKLNAELTVAKEKAEESEKLKLAFLANMSHEIRTPMNGILGFSEMLNQTELPVNKRLYYIKIIKQSANRLLTIVNDILDISKIETMQMTLDMSSFQLKDFFKDIYLAHTDEAERKKLNYQLDYRIPKAKSLILTDEQKLRQIVNYLIVNAIKFTQKGDIIITVDLVDDNVLILVKDTGIGISKDMQEHIFDHFRQVDNSLVRDIGGTGLGLAIGRGFIKLMNGTLTVESELNKGSEFKVTFPYKSADILENKEGIPLSIKPNSLKGYVVLIAEDEETNYVFLSEMLSIYGPTLIHAENGLEAVEAVIKNQSINLILMDLKMPVMDGFEAAKEIKRIRPQLPIIAQTAFAAVADKESVMKKGFDDYISKPIKPEALLKIIDRFS
jgi:signal transduction histidine kinase/CheY-like chemotaxis protein